MTINEITKLVEPMMDAYGERYRQITSSHINIIESISTHLSHGQGKQLRPLLTFLTARCMGIGDAPAQCHTLYSVVVAIEMLHNSTLIHDDVVDESDTRRGIATVNSRWGNKVAVLYGDYMLAMVMKTINELGNSSITSIINHTVLSMCQGELLQQQCCNHYDTEPQTCLTIIEDKTACFMAACCQIGALCATHDQAAIDRAQRFGLCLGMAFQLQDDMRDFLPTAVTGKPQGNDVREHKTTLPIIYAMQDKEIGQELSSMMNRADFSNSDIEAIATLVRGSNGWLRCRELLDDYLSQAHNLLKQMPQNIYSQGLANILLYLKENQE